ncbi:hypothetical protein ACN28S_39415 [Cystobacter fuscus]
MSRGGPSRSSRAWPSRAPSGGPLSRFISQATLKRAFAGLLVVMGVLILYENRGTFPALGRAAAMESPRSERPG